MAKQPPEPVTPDGGPILSPDDNGAQAPTVVEGNPSVVPDPAAADAAANGHDVPPTHDAAGYDLDADGQPIIPDPPTVPLDASGNPSGQPDNEALDAEVDDVDAVPEVVAYCHNDECVVATVQVWKPLDEVPIMCQCGQMLHAEPLEPAQPAEVVQDAPPA